MKKVVLVTGGTRGIGKACVLEFLKKDYNVVINYISNEEKANELLDYINSNNIGTASLYKADISSEIEVKNMINYIIDTYGKIDIVVNNAAIAIDTIFDDKTVDNFKKILDVNLIGTFLVSKYAGKKMLENKSGGIINVSSTNGIDTVYPESLDYDASKAGVISLTMNLALEFAPYVRVNSVAPGWVNTDMSSDLDDEFREKENKKIILNRFAEPEEIAKVISFVASDDASYINGTVIRVDGGSKRGE